MFYSLSKNRSSISCYCIDIVPRDMFIYILTLSSTHQFYIALEISTVFWFNHFQDKLWKVISSTDKGKEFRERLNDVLFVDVRQDNFPNTLSCPKSPSDKIEHYKIHSYGNFRAGLPNFCQPILDKICIMFNPEYKMEVIHVHLSIYLHFEQVI